MTFIFGMIASLWTALVTALGLYSLKEADSIALTGAIFAARSSIDQYSAQKAWASQISPVYVAVSDQTVPDGDTVGFDERNISTPSGVRLTAIAPINIPGHVYERGDDSAKMTPTLISLISKHNNHTLDKFETDAVKQLKKGQEEVYSVDYVNNVKFFRFIKPLIARDSCLKCHQAHGVRSGDIVGALNVTLPWNDFFSEIAEHCHYHLMSYFIIWGVGIFGIALGHNRLGRSMSNQDKIAREIQDSRNLFQSFLNSCSDVAFIKDDQHRYLFVNSATEEFFGRKEQELLGITDLDLMAPDTAATCHLSDIAAITAGEIASFEEKIGDRIYEIRKVPVNLPDGRTGVGGFARDITVVREQQMASERSEATLRSLFNAAPVGISLVTDRKMGWMNHTVEKISGYSRAELEGQPSRMIYASDEEYERVGRELYSGLTTTGSGQTQTVFRCKDGSLLDILLNCSAINSSDLSAGVVFTAMDITALKKAETGLRESEAKYRLLTENMKDVIWSLTPDMVYSYISPSVKQQLGYDHQEMIGTSIFGFLNTESQDHLKKVHRQNLESFYNQTAPPVTTFVVQQLSRSGNPVWIECTIHPVVNEGGEISGFQGVSRDISARKKAESERIEMERQLFHAQKLESLGILSGGIAHDFNNLLTIVIGNLQIVLLHYDPVSIQASLVHKALRGAERCANLSRQMLAYSGKGVFNIKNADLSDLVTENMQILRSAVSKTVNLKTELDENLFDVRCDPVQVQQIIMNLVINASESLEGIPGTVTISTGVRYFDERLIARNILCDTLQPQYMAFIEVADDGCGMDPKTRELLFDPFFTTKFTGRGLGMAVVYGIVKGHKGAITVDSETGKGTTITVYFPAAECLVISEPEQHPRPQGVRNGLQEGAGKATASVLVVDDEPDVLDLMVSMFELMGLRTYPATNGKDALEIFESDPYRFDLVLMDLSMPEMDGIEAFHRMARIRPDVRVIIASGYPEDALDGRLGSESRPKAFLKKPFEFESARSLIFGLLKDFEGNSA